MKNGMLYAAAAALGGIGIWFNKSSDDDTVIPSPIPTPVPITPNPTPVPITPNPTPVPITPNPTPIPIIPNPVPTDDGVLILHYNGSMGGIMWDCTIRDPITGAVISGIPSGIKAMYGSEERFDANGNSIGWYWTSELIDTPMGFVLSSNVFYIEFSEFVPASSTLQSGPFLVTLTEWGEHTWNVGNKTMSGANVLKAAYPVIWPGSIPEPSPGGPPYILELTTREIGYEEWADEGSTISITPNKPSYGVGETVTIKTTGWYDWEDGGWQWGTNPAGFLINGVKSGSDNQVSFQMNSNIAVIVLWNSYMIEGDFPEEDSGPPVMGPEWEGQGVDWESLPEGSSLVGDEDWVPHPGGGWMAPEDSGVAPVKGA